MSETTSTKKTEEPKYFRDEFIANSRKLFNVPPEVVEGALHESQESEFAKTFVANAVKNFMKRKVN